jgi:hypothetical protein
MQPKALYFPYMRFRNDAWVKAAALYWPSIARIVPRGVTIDVPDSVTVYKLRDELNFVIDVDPGPASAVASAVFAAFLERYGEEVRTVFSERIRDKSFLGAICAQSELAITHGSSVGKSRIREQLMDTHRGDVVGDVLSDLAHIRGDWIYMIDDRLTTVYLAVLTSYVAKANRLIPTTDDPAAQLATGASTVEHIAEFLLNVRLSAANESRSKGPHAAERIAILAISTAVPKDLSSVPVEKIIKARKRYASEFDAFQAEVHAAARELKHLGSDANPTVLDAYLRDQVEARFARTKQELDRALRGLKIETAEAIISARLELPAVLATAGVTLDQPVVTAVGGAVAVFTVGVAARRRRAKKLTPSPASYLLHVAKDVRPSSTISQAAAAIRRVGFGADG